MDLRNANLLSEDGLKEIVERPGWWSRPPALGLWLLLAISLLLMALGALSDASVYRSGLWRDEYFLTDLPPAGGGSWSACLARLGRCCGSAVPGSKEGSMPEAAESDRPADRLTDSPAADSPAADSPGDRAEEQERATSTRGRRPSQSSLHSVLSQMSWLQAKLPEAQALQLRNDMLQRLKPQLTSSLQERVLCRNTLWEVARRHKIHASSIQTHIWGRSGWVQGSLAVQRSPKLKLLALELEEGLPRAFVRVHTSRCHRLRAAVVSSHPVYELGMLDLHMTAAKRAKIMLDCVLGSLADGLATEASMRYHTHGSLSQLTQTQI